MTVPIRTSLGLELLSHVLCASLGKSPDRGQSTAMSMNSDINLLVPRSTDVDTAREARGSFCSTETLPGVAQAHARVAETGNVSAGTRASSGVRSVPNGKKLLLLIGHLGNKSFGLGVGLSPVADARGNC